jgi:hypothetical protein
MPCIFCNMFSVEKKPIFLSFFISICFFFRRVVSPIFHVFWYPKWCFRHKNSSFGPKHLQDQLQTLTFSEFWDPGFEKNRKSLKFQENRRNRMIYDCFWEFLASKSIPKPKTTLKQAQNLLLWAETGLLIFLWKKNRTKKKTTSDWFFFSTESK